MLCLLLLKTVIDFKALLVGGGVFSILYEINDDVWGTWTLCFFPKAFDGLGEPRNDLTAVTLFSVGIL